MSDTVFPVPVMGSWDFQWPIKRTPRYKTITQEPANNIGCVHIGLTPFTTWDYELDLSFIKGYGNVAGGTSPYQTIIGFYGTMKGAFDSWLYNDLQDNGEDSSSNLFTYTAGTADGSNKLFQTIRSMNGLLDLIQNINGTLYVYDDNTLKTLNSDYTYDEYGTITFLYTPTAGHVITWQGKFYFRCHFSEDTLASMQEELYGIWSIRTLRFHTELV